jgi:hypothetical protein
MRKLSSVACHILAGFFLYGISLLAFMLMSEDLEELPPLDIFNSFNTVLRM